MLEYARGDVDQRTRRLLQEAIDRSNKYGRIKEVPPAPPRGGMKREEAESKKQGEWLAHVDSLAAAAAAAPAESVADDGTTRSVAAVIGVAGGAAFSALQSVVAADYTAESVAADDTAVSVTADDTAEWVAAEGDADAVAANGGIAAADPELSSSKQQLGSSSRCSLM
jgi:hypothetical protein